MTYAAYSQMVQEKKYGYKEKMISEMWQNVKNW